MGVGRLSRTDTRRIAVIDQESVVALAIKAGVIDSADINSVHIPQGYIDDLAEFAYLVEEKVCQLLEKLADELAVMDDGRGHNVLKMAVAIIRDGKQ